LTLANGGDRGGYMWQSEHECRGGQEMPRQHRRST
jgi:hypothetical protein